MRVTFTNSGADSKGVFRLGNWEIEGEAYLYLVAGAIATLFAFILSAGFGVVARVCVSVVPLLGTTAWVKFFLVGRPPHFMGDWFEGLLCGKDFNLRPLDWAKTAHPQGLRVRGLTFVQGQPRKR